MEEGFGVPDEHLRLTQLPLTGVQLQIGQQGSASIHRTAGPLAPHTPGFAGQLLVPHQESLEFRTVGEASTSDTHVFKQTKVLHLMCECARQKISI